MTELENLLVQDEGLKLKPYQDTVGKLTIGVGRNLDDVGISAEEAMLLLKNDISKATTYAEGVFPWFSALSPPRQAVVVSLVFNLGMGGVMAFRKFLDAMSKQDWPRAKNELLASKWAGQVGKRASRLALILESDSFPSLS